jgi:endonuclease G
MFAGRLRMLRIFSRAIGLAIALVVSLYWLGFYSEQSASHMPEPPPALAAALPTGWPVVLKQDAKHVIQFLENRCYWVGYNDERANPLWVSYRLHAAKDGQVDKRQDRFLTDMRTSARIVHEHYNRSGYDRGHMAPNRAIGMLCDDEAQKETFLMSNISPQTKPLNQKWWERLERAELNYFVRLFHEVWVITGPVFGEMPARLPHGPVQIPEAFYKVYIAKKADQWHVLAFMVDQGVKGDEPFSAYRTTVAQIESRIGFNLLPMLDAAEQQRIKHDQQDPIWRLPEVDLLPARY